MTRYIGRMIFAGLLTLLCGLAAAAQSSAPLTAEHPAEAAVPVAQQNPAGAAVSAPEQSDESPVPVPAPSEKAIRYYRSGNFLWVLDQIWGLAIPALFLFTGLSARIRSLAQRLGGRWFFVIGIYLILFAALSFLLDLPLSYYEEFVRQHAYGLSNQTPQKWWSDSFKNLFVGCLMGVAFLWVPYLLLRKSPRRWWLYTALASIPILCFILLVAPVWVDPLFNKFGPMKDKALEADILSLAHRAGIEGGRVFEVNKSVDTKMVNAYVSGMFGTKRIVLWDTIIAKLERPELLVVMAHEMGHYVLHHVALGIVFGFFGTLVALYAAYRFSGGLIDRFKGRFGFDRLSDVASLPLIVLLAGCLSFVLTPVGMAFGRHLEHEADRFALEITRSNHAAALAFVKLQEENLSMPRPGWLYKLWRSSHPPIGERIDFCNEYRPWAQGKRLKYERYFRSNL